MKVVSSRKKGERIFKCIRFNHTTLPVKSIRPFWIEPVGDNWWFNLDKGDWTQGYDSYYAKCSSYYAMSHHGFKDAYSLKAVKRLICKWNVPKGTVFRASLPFVGFDFFITKP